MSRMKKGNGLLRFLVFAALFALVLTGCNGARKYEAVDLSSETAAESEMSGNGADPAAESTDTGASGSGDADVQALGEALPLLFFHYYPHKHHLPFSMHLQDPLHWYPWMPYSAHHNLVRSHPQTR